jgi:PcfJ-like protein
MNKIARSPLQERLHKSAELDVSLKNILRETKKRGKRTTRLCRDIHNFLENGNGQFDMFDGVAVDLRQYYEFTDFRTVEAQDFLLPIIRAKTVRMFQNPDILRGLLMTSMFKSKAIRPIDAWRPRFNCPERQFNDLVRYLFEQFPMPRFFYSAFKTQSPQQVMWFVALAQGTSVRSLRLPMPLSARGMHIFLQAPPQYSVGQALRFGQVLSLGGSVKLAHKIVRTRLAHDFSQPIFWESVLHFLIKNEGISFEEVREVIGFCHFIKFQLTVFADPENGDEYVTNAPIMPDFSLKGRNLTSLFRIIATFENEIKRCINLDEAVKIIPLPRTKFQNFEENITTDLEAKRLYTIRQITNDMELMTEGRVMEHCVYTYLELCLNHCSSIWTLAYTEGSSVVNKTLTIEVRGDAITQIRGKINRSPTDFEKKIIRKWAEKEGLFVSSLD